MTNYHQLSTSPSQEHPRMMSNKKRSRKQILSTSSLTNNTTSQSSHRSSLLRLNASLIFVSSLSSATTGAAAAFHNIASPARRSRHTPLPPNTLYPNTKIKQRCSYDDQYRRSSLTASPLTTERYFLNRDQDLVDGETSSSYTTGTSTVDNSSLPSGSPLEDVLLPSWALNPPLLKKPLLNVGNMRDPDKETKVESQFNMYLSSLEKPKIDIPESNDSKINGILTEASLPPWLIYTPSPSHPSPIEKFNELESTLKTYLSPSECQLLCHAVDVTTSHYTSSSNNKQQQQLLTGLYDYLTLLVTTTEMGIDGLIAGTFHYVSCVLARQRQDSATTVAAVGLSSPSPRYYLSLLSRMGMTPDGTSFGDKARTIARDAAMLKQVEMIASSLSQQPSSLSSHGDGRVTNGTTTTALLSSVDDAANFRNLLLTVNAGGNWRALALRAVACLFRLRGLERTNNAGGPSSSGGGGPVAREALYIYAPLARRMGLKKLQEELEMMAFRALYPRQHSAVTKLCGSNNERDGDYCGISGSSSSSSISSTTDGVKDVDDRSSSSTMTSSSSPDDLSVREGMESVLADVTKMVKRRLIEDDTFINEIASVSVTARVKEPFSLWRKILKSRHHHHGDNSDASAAQRWTEGLSPFLAHDAVALRVILSAKKLTKEEGDDITEAREIALCYYVLTKIMDRWRPMDTTESGMSKFKDYIKFPKENGYRSLHYSAKVRWRGEDWPFEVQVRSEDMHNDAEYGEAAHWDYKLQNGGKHTVPLDKSSDNYLKSAEEWRSKQEQKKQQQQQQNTFIPSFDHDVDDDYEASSFDEAIEKKMRMERRRARHRYLAPYLEALRVTRSNMARERVFVFVTATPSSFINGMDEIKSNNESDGRYGAILSLPAGACLLDALKEVETRFSSSTTSGVSVDTTNSSRINKRRRRRRGEMEMILRNGVMTSVTKRLKNGDVLVMPQHIYGDVEEEESGDDDVLLTEHDEGESKPCFYFCDLTTTTTTTTGSATPENVPI